MKNKEFEMLAKTFKGLEQVLATELVQLGANNVQVERRAVSFTGDKRMLYTAICVCVPHHVCWCLSCRSRRRRPMIYMNK